jgi:hypothetical protein
MLVRSVRQGGNLLIEIALTFLGVLTIGLPLALAIILMCR